MPPLIIVAQVTSATTAIGWTLLASILLAGLCTFCGGFTLGQLTNPDRPPVTFAVRGWPPVFLLIAAGALNYALLLTFPAPAPWEALWVIAICGCGCAALSLAGAIGLHSRWSQRFSARLCAVPTAAFGISMIIFVFRTIHAPATVGPQSALSGLAIYEAAMVAFLLLGCYGPPAFFQRESEALLIVPGLLLLDMAPLFALATTSAAPGRLLWFLGFHVAGILVIFLATLPNTHTVALNSHRAVTTLPERLGASVPTD